MRDILKDEIKRELREELNPVIQRLESVLLQQQQVLLSLQMIKFQQTTNMQVEP